MEEFTVLDVIRYNSFVSSGEYGPKMILETMFNKFLNKITDDSVKIILKQFPEWIYISYRENQKFNKDLIKILPKIIENKWQAEECKWLLDIKYDMLIKRRICCCKYSVLSHPKELFYVFCELLRQKFGYDTNLICIIDDLLKKYIF